MPMLRMHWKSWWQPEPVQLALSFMHTTFNCWHHTSPSINVHPTSPWICLCFLCRWNGLIFMTEPGTINWCRSWLERKKEGLTLQPHFSADLHFVSCFVEQMSLCCWWPTTPRTWQSCSEIAYADDPRQNETRVVPNCFTCCSIFMSTQLGGTHVTVSLGWCLSNDFLLLVKHRPAPLSARGVDRMVELLERPLSQNFGGLVWALSWPRELTTISSAPHSAYSQKA